ncbi:similar to Saccharomyces cerevisiae YHL031C GOS1 v-SNARE protein involved in Golgi transport, homolog of the mammalian protein GOS-28/GS28 [Maudiozyma barnettii]|uniref:Golgi SNAP receptor complex member 1 n=1 Tax=Maudiozyma barnettii TaxID=61262 RepID=A0A8H2ZGQ8_9SACH|nr:Gos1p [Kazachstania barnettii]CAB4252995.1 similar to Saccharomyces cerevisiae YHL031C GOS1 v-SNARE protein involved in Golgi transport, homolog of the mammalian protein GOS-28/GS28 [Kazachstania barnettii]CAD1780153.1 similar to Saccharomyces cerevisiae YHL031C GOS1 v-SNARE protein involved in Golgi transport, homolog of the mammalian protein GOS-28/GS28 [Kazachstania barnettii]
MSKVNSSSFVTVRGQAISLETQTDSLLSRYSTFAQTTSSEQSGKEKKLDTQIESTLKKRQDIIDSLNDICNENPSISASKLSQLQRHKEILQEHWKSFQNIRSSIQQERNRLNLLFSVKNDIAQHNSNTNINDEEEYIQDESRRIDQSHNVVDRLISQAWETRDHFTSQNNVLNNVNNKTLQVLQRIPGLNHLLGKINTRRKKNAAILASVMTICILLLFFTW